MWNKIREINWKNPLVWVTGALFLLGPFALGMLFKMGLVLALIMTASILVLVNKMPSWTRRVIKRHLLIADLVLSTFVTAGVAALFAPGLILAMAAVTTAGLLSLTLPYVPA